LWIGNPPGWVGYPIGSGSTLYDEAADIRTGWRIVEVYGKFDNAAGTDIIKFYLDGDPLTKITWSALSINYGVVRVRIGPHFINATPYNGDFIYFDDVVGDGAYIGF
jgi:hypothetical protein